LYLAIIDSNVHGDAVDINQTILVGYTFVVCVMEHCQKGLRYRYEQLAIVEETLCDAARQLEVFRAVCGYGRIVSIEQDGNVAVQKLA
jgi:hypothetical protein